MNILVDRVTNHNNSAYIIQYTLNRQYYNNTIIFTLLLITNFIENYSVSESNIKKDVGAKFRTTYILLMPQKNTIYYILYVNKNTNAYHIDINIEYLTCQIRLVHFNFKALYSLYNIFSNRD